MRHSAMRALWALNAHLATSQTGVVSEPHPQILERNCNARVKVESRAFSTSVLFGKRVVASER